MYSILSLKEQLANLYISKWDTFKTEIQRLDNYNDLNHPHLLSLTSEFENEWQKSDLRLMIYGIDTNGWGVDKDIYQETNGKAIDLLQNVYENFYFKGENWRYGQTFWNYFYSIHELLQFKLGKKISVLWNNTFEINHTTHTIEKIYFNTTIDEIKILKPDIVFLLGTNALHSLNEKLGNQNVNDLNYEVLSSEDVETFLYYSINKEEYPEIKNIVKKIIVTYHPNARGKAGIKLKLMIDELIKELNDLK